MFLKKKEVKILNKKNGAKFCAIFQKLHPGRYVELKRKLERIPYSELQSSH